MSDDIPDPAFMDAIGAGAAPAPAPEAPPPPAEAAPTGDDAPDPAFMAALKGATAPAGDHPATPPPAPPHVSHGPTRFQKATAPAPKSAAPAAEPSWGQTLQTAAGNFLPSIGGVWNALGHAVTHPAETVDTLGNLGSGAISQAAGALGVQQDPKTKAATEALVKTLEAHYAQAYGSVAGYKKYVSQDPASAMMDIATILDPAAGAMGKLGDAGSIAAKVGAAGQTAASFIDPIQGSLKVAALPIKGAGNVAKLYSSAVSGVHPEDLTAAAKAGATTDPVLRSAFLRPLGGAPPNEMIDAVQGAIKQASDQRSAQYIQGMQGVKGQTLPQISYAPVIKALRDADASNYGTVVDPITGARNLIHPTAAQATDAIAQKVNWYASQPLNSTAHNLIGFDELKRSIGDIQQSYQGDRFAYQRATDLYNSTVGAIKQSGPVGAQYANVMEQYSNASQELNNLSKTFLGSGRNPTDAATFRKIMRAKNSDTGQTLLGDLAQYDPRIPYMAAGHALHDILPHGAMRQIFDVLGVGGAHFVTGPLGPVGTLGHMAASSPRISGLTAFGAGAAGSAVGAVTNPLVTRPGYYAGRAEQDQDIPTVPGAAGDPVWNSMKQIESGNRQIGANGQPIISPKGATGISQIMPANGPKAAAMAGVPWDPQKFKWDQDYNETLGQAFYQNLKEKWGDPLKAAAAYNGSDAQVENAIKQAQQKGGDWIDHLSAGETRRYVQNIRKQTGFASGGKVESDKDKFERLVNRLMTLAKKAKKTEDKRTEPLLKASDTAVAKALAVAQAAI